MLRKELQPVRVGGVHPHWQMQAEKVGQNLSRMLTIVAKALKLNPVCCVRRQADGKHINNNRLMPTSIDYMYSYPQTN